MEPDTQPYDLDVLEDYAAAAVEDARELHDAPLPELVSRTTHDAREFDEEPVSDEDFDTFLDDLFDELDELYGVESDDGVRQYMKKRTGYDWGKLEHAKRTGRNSVLAGSMAWTAGMIYDDQITQHAIEAAQQEPLVGLAGAGAIAAGVMAVDKLTKRIGVGNFVHMPYPITNHKHRDINISPDAEPAAFVYPTTTSEMTHAYQDLWHSPSFEDAVYQEGMDVGAQLAVGDRISDESQVWEKDNSWRRLFTLGYAYASAASEGDELEPDALEEIGFTEDEAVAAVEAYDKHGSIAREEAAVLGGAGLYVAAQEEGYEVYEEVFNGDYDRVPDWVPVHGD